MAIVVRVVFDVPADADDTEAVEAIASYLRRPKNKFVIIGGEVIGVNARVDLAPPAEPVDVASHDADED